MNINKLSEIFSACSSSYEVRTTYINMLKTIYNDFREKTSSWEIFKTSRNRIASYSLTYDDPKATEIKVCYYNICCYSTLLTYLYIANEYNRLGENRFFSDLSTEIGHIDFVTLEDLNNAKLFILDNTSELLDKTSLFYKSLSSYVAFDADDYIKKIKWFESICNAVCSIILTVEFTLRSYLYNNAEDADEFMRKIIPNKGIPLTEIPNEITTRRED